MAVSKGREKPNEREMHCGCLTFREQGIDKGVKTESDQKRVAELQASSCRDLILWH
jgi:hypothetical protein